jgi:hypothetical protein
MNLFEPNALLFAALVVLAFNVWRALRSRRRPH